MNFSNHFNNLSSSIFTSSSLPPLIKADSSFPQLILSEFDLSYVSKTARTTPITLHSPQSPTSPVEPPTIKTEPNPIQYKQHRITSTNTSLIQVPEHYSTDDEDEKKLVDLINDPDLSGWKEAISKKGLTVYSKKIEGSSSLLLKTEATIPYPIQTIITAINNINIRRKWDKGFSKIELIETNSTTTTNDNANANANANYTEETLYLYMKFPLFLPDRDWIQRKKCWINYCGNANTVLFHYKSIEHPQYPPKTKPVRAEMIISGQYIIQTGNNTCKLTMINHADVKIGSTLQGAVNKKAPETPRDFILNLIKGCEMV